MLSASPIDYQRRFIDWSLSTDNVPMKNRITYIWRALFALERPMVKTDHITCYHISAIEKC